jgi:aspartokinase-like uncharacterized kinase
MISKMPNLTVIKIGGSLLDLPDLHDRLDALRPVLPGHWLTIIGGGDLAEYVRRADHDVGLPDDAAHWLAIRAMTIQANRFSAALPHWTISRSIGACQPIWQQGHVAILEPLYYAMWDESACDAPLPHAWGVTADSLAARVAIQANASRLVLLKSAALGEINNIPAAVDQGLIDAYFPTAVRDFAPIDVINLRAESVVLQSLRPPPPE